MWGKAEGEMKLPVKKAEMEEEENEIGNLTQLGVETGNETREGSSCKVRRHHS